MLFTSCCIYCVNKTEGILFEFLIKNKSNLEIKKIIQQYNAPWYKENYKYDFYIELANGKKIIIECDGDQHYEFIPHFHNNCRENFESQKKRDIIKMNYALQQDISLIRISQIEVYKNKINWKKEITDAINEIKNENEVSIKLLGCLKDRVCCKLDE